jgi:hypothetical protein
VKSVTRGAQGNWRAGSARFSIKRSSWPLVWPIAVRPLVTPSGLYPSASILLRGLVDLPLAHCGIDWIAEAARPITLKSSVCVTSATQPRDVPTTIRCLSSAASADSMHNRLRRSMPCRRARPQTDVTLLGDERSDAQRATDLFDRFRIK